MSEYFTLGSWDSQGVPTYLDSIETLSPDITNRILDVLPEHQNVPVAKPDYISDTSSRNLIIQSTREDFIGAEVYATFLYEGAGYRNVAGYYVYPLNGGNLVPTKNTGTTESPNWVPMTYSDRNNVDTNGKSTLKKTIIFPNASLPSWANSNGRNSLAGGGNLLPGSRVKLLYDVNNPTTPFPNNTGIGFFLIPNGWNGTVYDAAERVHTDSVFNTNNSVQSILLYDSESSSSSAGTELIISFEDIMRPGGDSDFNDVVIKATCTPDYAAFGVENALVLPLTGAITSDDLVLDRTGMYFMLQNSTIASYIASGASNFYFEQTITMTNLYNQYDTLLTILQDFQLANGGVVTTNVTEGEELSDDQPRTITITLTVPKADLQNYIYVFNSYVNRGVTSPADSNVSGLVDFQNIYIANGQNNITNKQITVADSNNVTHINESVTPIYKNLSSPYAMGDPHITTIYGKRYDLPNNTNCYEMYNNKETIINAKMDFYPMNKKYPIYKDLTFISMISISVGDKCIFVNMFHPDCYYEKVNGVLIKIDLSGSNKFGIFTMFNENELPSVAPARRKNYARLSKTQQFLLKYVHFKSSLLNDVYVELFFITHRKDFVNSVSILSNGLNLVDATGAFVHKRLAKVISEI